MYKRSKAEKNLIEHYLQRIKEERIKNMAEENINIDISTEVEVDTGFQEDTDVDFGFVGDIGCGFGFGEDTDYFSQFNTPIDVDISERLEFTFEVKDKYKAIVNKIIKVYPKLVIKINARTDIIMTMLVNSININTAKLNWIKFKKSLDYLILNKAEKKKLKKLIKKIVTEEFIETEPLCNNDAYSKILGTDSFDVITKRAGAITIEDMLFEFDEYSLVKIYNLFNKGSKTFITLSQEYFASIDYSENILGMMIGTLGKVNENIKVYTSKADKGLFGCSNFNIFEENTIECKTVLKEQTIDSMQMTVLNVPDLLKTISSNREFDKLHDRLKEESIEELNIPIIDVIQQLSVKFSVELSDDNEKLVSEFSALDKILNEVGFLTIREVYAEKFNRAVFKNSIIKNYLIYQNVYKENTLRVNYEEKMELVEQVKKTYGKDSLICEEIYKEFLFKYNTYNAESFIKMFINGLDEIITDEITEGIWNFECKTSNIPRFTIAKIMTALEEAGSKISFLEINTIE